MSFLAGGNFQRTDAKLLGISQPSVSKSVHRVVRLIAGLRPCLIKFPEEAELPDISQGFYFKKGLPGVVGAVDCTHIWILGPGGPHNELYRNRKGFFSINTHIMCDDKLYIRDVVSSWWGSAHDSRIFNESALKQKVQQLQPQYHLVGDRGYACSRYMLTPLTNPTSHSQRRYNYAQSATRMIIEQVNGVLKRRFPCLTKRLNFSPERSAAIIVACAVLHNLGLRENDFFQEDPNDPPLAPDAMPEDIYDEREEDVNIVRQGNAKRTTIINRYFQ